MADMSILDRTRVYRGLMRRWSKDNVPCSFTKTQLYSPSTNTGAVAAVDTWVDTHQGTATTDNVGMNGALTAQMRTALSAEQKTDLMIAILAMRRGLSYLVSVFGEVD